MNKQSRGWWGIALSAALLVPALAPGPAAAAPFGYVSAADNQKSQAQQEQDHRQAEERDRQQREQQERQRGEQEQRSRQEQQARQAQEQQARQAQQRQVQDQQQQRQAEQQQQLQRQAEQQRAERQRQAEQQREMERQRQAERAQQERMRAVQQQRQQTEQQRPRQEQPANDQQAQQLRVEQRAREEQLRRARQQQSAQEQVRRVREEQAGSFHRVSTGPFGYIRRTDEVRGQGQPQSQVQQPVSRESRPLVHPEPARPGREEQRPVPRSTPFHSAPEQPGRPTRILVPPGSLVPNNGPGYRNSPYGTVRPGSPPIYRRPESHTEISRPAGTFPPTAADPRGSFPGGTVRSGSSSRERDHREVATPVPPIRRGGHGSLDSYFGRPPRRHRETVRGGYYPVPYYPGGYYPGGYYPDPYGSYYPYGPSYFYLSPYDCYPPPLYYPAPGPTIVESPPPDVVVVPAPETVIEPEATESVSLADVIADVEEAWEGGKLDLLTRHLLPDGQVQIYRDGEWVDSMSRAEFERKTEQAFRDYDTVSMRFEKPELLSDDDTGAPRARARATHIYKTRSGQERRVTVTYAFRRYGRVWRIVGLDYEPQARQRAALPPASTEGIEHLKGAAASLAGVPSHAAARHPRAAAPALRLASAPAVRVRDLLKAHQPRPIATMKWVQAPRKTVYTLQAMRGIAPGTIAWALYRQGAKRPVETGVTDISALPPSGWMAVRVQQPQLVTLSSSAPARPRSARLAIHSFTGTGLVLTAAKAPAKAAPRRLHRNSRRR